MRNSYNFDKMGNLGLGFVCTQLVDFTFGTAIGVELSYGAVTHVANSHKSVPMELQCHLCHICKCHGCIRPSRYAITNYSKPSQAWGRPMDSRFQST